MKLKYLMTRINKVFDSCNRLDQLKMAENYCYRLADEKVKSDIMNNTRGSYDSWIRAKYKVANARLIDNWDIKTHIKNLEEQNG